MPTLTVARATALLLCVHTTFAACSTAEDCEELGDCVLGSCVCDAGFTGPSCGELDLLPNAPLEGCSEQDPRLWPSNVASNNGSASAWGFSPVFDPSDGLYHAFVTVACNASGVLANGGGESWIAHLTSSLVDGDYKYAGMAVPQTTFGPHAAVASDGTFVLVFRVNVLVNTTLCAGNGTGEPLPDAAAALDSSFVPPSALVSGNPESGTSIYVAWAKAANGPWAVQRINITGGGSVHKSNPSIRALRSPIGTDSWVMAYRYNPPGGGELNAIALAPSFLGPWRCVTNVTATPAGHGNYEDPFVWQHPATASGRGEGIGHMLLHAGPAGYHMWGPLNGSTPWRASPTGAHAFGLNVSQTDDTILTLRRRERPELVFDASGRPTLLITGVQLQGGASGGAAFSYAQRVNSNVTAVPSAQLMGGAARSSRRRCN